MNPLRQVLLLAATVAACSEHHVPAPEAGIHFDGSPRLDAGDPLDADSLQVCDPPMRAYPFEPGTFAGCERVLGTVNHAYSSAPDMADLASVRWIDGSLNLFSMDELTSLRGVERLEHVGGLNIRITRLLESLAPLANLRTVEDMLFIDSNRALGSLEGLGRLETVGRLIIEMESEFKDSASLASLGALRRVHGDVRFWHIRREEVDAFLARVTVDGSVTLDGEVIVEGEGDAGP
jgi:hypothetical protein